MKEKLKLIFKIHKRYFRKYTWFIVIYFFVILISQGFALVVPYVTKYYFDTALTSNSVKLIVFIPLGILLFSLLSATINYVSDFFYNKISMIVNYNMKNELIKKIHRCKISDYNKLSPSYLFNRILVDTSLYNSVNAIIFALIAAYSISVVVAFVLIGNLNLYLLIPVTLLIVLNIYLSVKLGDFLAKYQKKYVEDYTNINSQIEEQVQSTFLVKIYKLELFFQNKLKRFYNNFLASYLKLLTRSYQNSFLIKFLELFTDFIIYAVGGYFIINGKITVGGLFVFLGLYRRVYSPLLFVVNQIMNIHKNVPIFERIDELLSLEPEYKEENDIKLDVKDRIVLKDITFGYNDEQILLENVNAQFKKGKISLIKGDSGVGKTSLLSILLGIYLPQKGDIYYDELKFKTAMIPSLRNTISYVEQEPTMINDTIYNNINLGISDDKNDVVKACKLANIDEFINSLPDRYDTKIGEDGQRLSTGQKQRIAIARALLRKPQIILFDEPTSSIDSESEILVHNSIKKIAKDKFIIIVSHKPETLQIADVVYKVEDKKITVQEL